MKWIINNERRPEKEGLYYAEDSTGNKMMARFREGHWRINTSHPVAKWLDEAMLSFTFEDMENAFLEGRGGYYTFKDYMKEKYKIDIP